MLTINERVKKAEKQRRIFLFTSMIAVNIGLMVWFTSNVSLFGLGIVLFVTIVTYGLGNVLYGLVSSDNHYNFSVAPLTMIPALALFIFVLFSLFNLPYIDDCKQLRELNRQINTEECIQYAVDNPDATGEEITDALTAKDTDVLKRSLIPKDTDVLKRSLIPYP